MSVYQTYLNQMNDHIKAKASQGNPFVFRHIHNLRGMKDLDDSRPCVVFASPGMLQSGLSRQLFDAWCQDSRNACVIPGYCVEGTLAKHILSEPKEVPLLSGQVVPLRMSVRYVSFSAHRRGDCSWFTASACNLTRLSNEIKGFTSGRRHVGDAAAAPRDHP